MSMKNCHDIHQKLVREGSTYTLEDIKYGIDQLHEMPNSLIVINIPKTIFENSQHKIDFERIFKEFDCDCKFVYLQGFHRVKILMKSNDVALLAKIKANEIFVGNNFPKSSNDDPQLKIECLFANVTNAMDYLELPKKEKQYLISPPASPPDDWEPRLEATPAINYDLLAAIASLSPDKSDINPESMKRCKIIKSRAKISAIEKFKVIKSYEEGKNAKTLGRILNINVGTVKNILYRYYKIGDISKGKIGGYKKKIINEEIGESLLGELDKNPHLTLKEMRIFLQEKGLKLSITTISNYLKNKFYTFKEMRYSIGERNSEHTKELRKSYVVRFLKECIRSRQCIHINEVYCNKWSPKFIGRSFRETNVSLQIPPKRDDIITIVMAIGKNGPIHFKVHNGCISQSVYQDFLVEVSLKLDSQIYYFINDNRSIHNTCITANTNHKLLNLPPYSSFLNPTYDFFENIKSKLRKKLSVLEINENFSKFQAINECCDQIFADEKDSNLKNGYNHIKIYYPSCVLLENIY